MSSSPRLIEVRARVLKQNDLLAQSLREQFLEFGVYVVSFVSSPGSGKTKFLEELMKLLGTNLRVAALVGDLATDNDADRLRRATPQVKQITTGTVCHLDASMIERAIASWDLAEIDLLCIENVGNLVCPSSYDLGENLRFVLLSTTEGEDKPLKYPTIFNTADLAIITKLDMAEAADFDCVAACANINAVRPGMRIVQVSAKTGFGMEAVASQLREYVLANRKAAPLGSAAAD
ncbi:hydrogenase nickel incorporation protein HypB [Granulicella sibirica]|uniref:[NiFe] hydrogenase nickel incorporation-associated protein HypB n=1 Tax=Granulicella sibirica TaxID=2479048 RepID=A0A4Q0SY60_9BACT|nr:hydrogenase nickel incorporation protein HypB [Granulicella sibirica]RXH54111.1 [NiFe] hydrogenase nickel incorporation-associated protein HypB [Granulicella sibirica]